MALVINYKDKKLIRRVLPDNIFTDDKNEEFYYYKFRFSWTRETRTKVSFMCKLWADELKESANINSFEELKEAIKNNDFYILEYSFNRVSFKRRHK